jgi:hypothetical protein
MIGDVDHLHIKKSLNEFFLYSYKGLKKLLTLMHAPWWMPLPPKLASGSGAAGNQVTQDPWTIRP